ncbi:alpha-L-fucosidase [Paenibacillus thalictri]|uniref:alpha-L-fucosidase n=1 Tax=Paenibacillus thalictri TaxID=2527873 RepID=A0A4Q9DG44_9BACL|nr:alpha-L-fucosidase [Paenibacillus thalictri]
MEAGPFSNTWESLRAYQVPDWYANAKFGIFVHWGLYAVPAIHNEWYSRNMYQRHMPEYQLHRERFGAQEQFGYKDFIPLFTAERFDPDAWAGLFRRSGAQYVVSVAEHHDGFAMYDSSFTEWNAVRMGPRRDVIGELAGACRKHYLTFGLSSHRAENWWFFEGGRQFASDVADPRFAAFYGPAQPQALYPNEVFLEDWLARTCELADKYEPQLVYFDWWIAKPVFEPYLRRFAAYYYNRAAERERGVVINYKHGAFPEGTAVYDLERGQSEHIRSLPWQTCTSVSKSSWCHVNNQEYKTSREIVGDLIDTVSKNGNLLLNIGPRADGAIPEEEEAILLDLGRWLAVNGQAIYNSRPWRLYGEGPTPSVGGEFTDSKRQPYTARDIRFTMRCDHLYAAIMGWPEDGKVSIRSLGYASRLYEQEIGGVELLGSQAKLQWSRNNDGLHVTLPDERPCEHAFIFKIDGLQK